MTSLVNLKVHDEGEINRDTLVQRSICVNLVEQVLMFANPYDCILHSQYLIQLKLRSATETLGTEESGHCREMFVVEAEITVNVQTFPLKKMVVVDRWPLVEVEVSETFCYHLIKTFDPQGNFCKFGKRNQGWRIQPSSFPVSQKSRIAYGL